MTPLSSVMTKVFLRPRVSTSQPGQTAKIIHRSAAANRTIPRIRIVRRCIGLRTAGQTPMGIPAGMIIAMGVQLAAGTVHDTVTIDPPSGASAALTPTPLR